MPCVRVPESPNEILSEKTIFSKEPRNFFNWNSRTLKTQAWIGEWWLENTHLNVCHQIHFHFGITQHSLFWHFRFWKTVGKPNLGRTFYFWTVDMCTTCTIIQQFSWGMEQDIYGAGLLSLALSRWMWGECEASLGYVRCCLQNTLRSWGVRVDGMNDPFWRTRSQSLTK